jgi:hypothetical protein
MELFLELAQKLGPVGAALFAVLWWFERAERKEMTALLLKMLPDNVSALKDAKAAIDMLRVAVGGGKQEPKG